MHATATTTSGPVDTPVGSVAVLIDGGDLDCGSGLLLLITRAMRRIESQDLLGIRSEQPSVRTDLAAWAELIGHPIADEREHDGAWWFAVGKRTAEVRSGSDARPDDSVFTQGERTPVGHRLWVYTNFDCNLACSYCCAQSSPKAAARRISLDVAKPMFEEFREQGGAELIFTGGEPFMHPDLVELLALGAGLERTLLTNGMIYSRGNRRDMLEAIDRDVILQISLDSATSEVHDRQRGARSWERAVQGIELAGTLGFRVKIAATLFDEDPLGVQALHDRLDVAGIAPEDRVIRPVAEEGFADTGVHISLDSVEPEPTVTADGAWWHPVAVTNPNMRIADAPLPLSEVFGVVRDTIAVHDAAAAAGREVFRCA